MMNARAKMSSKGQIVVPKEIRDAKGWAAGTEFEFVPKGKGVVIQPVKNLDPRFPPITWDEFDKHRLKYNGPPVTIEDMDRAILEEAKRRWNAENG
jgi:AbrB family looped-hinge helix DNA binding protein